MYIVRRSGQGIANIMHQDVPGTTYIDFPAFFASFGALFLRPSVLVTKISENSAVIRASWR